MKDDDQPDLFKAMQERDKILSDLESRSPSFNDMASGAVLEYLRECQPATGEEIVDYLKLCEIIPKSKDDRGYGPVFMQLSKSKRIVRVGFVPRRKGHAAPGASVWELP